MIALNISFITNKAADILCLTKTKSFIYIIDHDFISFMQTKRHLWPFILKWTVSLTGLVWLTLYYCPTVKQINVRREKNVDDARVSGVCLCLLLLLATGPPSHYCHLCRQGQHTLHTDASVVLMNRSKKYI